MSIIPKLLALGLATSLSTGPQRQIDFSMAGPDGQRLNQIWLVTYVVESGREVVAQAMLANGSSAPFIAVDEAQLESMMPTVRRLAKAATLNCV